MAKKTKTTKKRKKDDLTQYERVAITAGNAPVMSVVFIGKDGWRVLAKRPNHAEVELWRLKQAGGDETIQVSPSQEVMIQKGYLDQD